MTPAGLLGDADPEEQIRAEAQKKRDFTFATSTVFEAYMGTGPHSGVTSHAIPELEYCPGLRAGKKRMGGRNVECRAIRKSGDRGRRSSDAHCARTEGRGAAGYSDAGRFDNERGPIAGRS